VTLYETYLHILSWGHNFFFLKFCSIVKVLIVISIFVSDFFTGYVWELQEVPLTDVCEAFKVPRGMVQALQENAGRFASMVSAFCERLGWHDLEGLVSKFQNRVSFGVRAEIAELTSIPFVKVLLEYCISLFAL